MLENYNTMNRYLLAIIVLLTCCNVMSSSDHKYIINVADEHQTHEGWGVSLCWWANMCGQWPDDKINELVDWLVSPEGLNYNIFRYNIGGGDDPNHANCTEHHMGNGKGLRAEMEGFKSYDGDSYHWERDAAQRKIMLKIKEKRPDAIFEAFSNSAPYYMTYSGCCAGNWDSNSDNLKPEYYTAFANYLVDVCKHYKDTYGIEFRTLEPFNEPNTNYWGCNGGQEGCHFNPSSQVEFIKVLYPILKASGLSTVISASDETNVGTSIGEIQEYINGGVMDKVAQWNVHTYGGDIVERCKLANLVRSQGKRFWMSETGSGGSGISGNLGLAQRLIDDIEYLRPTAWVDWQYVEEWNDQWCLVQGEFGNQYYWKVKNYYVRQHFSKYIKPGYTFVSAVNGQTLAAINPEKTELVIVSINNSDETAYHSADILGCRPTAEPYAYITTGDSDGKPLAYDLQGKRISFTLEPQSIATIVLPIIKYSDDYTCLPIAEGAAYAIIPQYNKTTLLYGSLGHYDGIPRIDYINNENTWNKTYVSGNQVWTFHRNGDGYKVKTIYWDEYLTNKDEYWLHVDWWQNDNSQDFYVTPIYDNLVKIISCRDSKALDLQDEKSDAGTNVGLWDYGSDITNAHRNWYLMRLPENSELNEVEMLGKVAPFTIQATSAALNVRCTEPTTVDVYGIDGRRVATKTVYEEGTIPLSKGIYIYKATADASRRTGKVIIR